MRLRPPPSLRRYESPSGSPAGPFVAAGANFDFARGGGVTFPRLWGETYTGAADLALLTHHQDASAARANGTLVKAYYFAPVKRVAVMADGVARAVWWGANDALRGARLEVVVQGDGAGGGGGRREDRAISAGRAAAQIPLRPRRRLE